MQSLLAAIAHMPVPLEAGRIFHGRGGLYPDASHWTLDAYPPVFVLTSFAPVEEGDVAILDAALRQRWAVLAPGQSLHWVLQQRGEALRVQGRSDTRLMAGEVPQPHVVQEAGLHFAVDVLRGQNHGLFLDTAQCRRWVAQHVQHLATSSPSGPRVLNLFAYTCAFSVVALHAGAAQVVNVDMARGPLAVGQRNHQLNGLRSGAVFWAHDLFTSWGKVGRNGPYDLVIADPPSYQKGSFVATKDYARLARRIPQLLQPGGHALLCLNAPELDEKFLLDVVQAEAPELEFVQRLPNPPSFADVQPQRALKALVFCRPG